MANRSTPPDKIAIDPLFNPPPGAEDVFAFTRDDVEVDDGSDYSIGAEDDFGDDLSDYDSLEDYDDDYDVEDLVILETPDSFRVLSQTVRRTDTGQLFIDVVVETDDIAGAVNYEIQAVKLS